jgi:NAD+ synthase
LHLDADLETQRIELALRDEVLGSLRKRGAVVAMSGGIDSSVVATLCARALGPERVIGLMMPERDSSPDALRLAQMVAESVNIPYIIEDIAPALTALGCYERQIEAIRQVVPEYGTGWRFKLVIPPILDHDRLNVTRLVVSSPDGHESTARLTARQYLQLVAANGLKQQTRKMLEYYHASRLNYAVASTPNRLEYDLGFFVRHGDGAADVMPIAHLYKSQVYDLAAHLGVAEEVRSRPPTTDTYSLPQTQEEFYFALPYPEMDLCLWAWHHNVPASAASELTGLSADQIDRVYRDIQAKMRAAFYLHHVARPWEPSA